MEKTTSDFLSYYGELHRAGELTYQPPQPSEETLAIRKKMGELAMLVGEESPVFEEQQLVSLEVYSLALSDKKQPPHKQAEHIARTYMGQHINRLRQEQGVDSEALTFRDVVPQEQVVVLTAHCGQIPGTRRHGNDPAFLNVKWLADPLRSDVPRLHIHPNKVGLVLRVDTPDTPPLPEWLPRVLPKAVVVNIGSQAMKEAAF